ncbi:hypothetical protein BHE74_00024400 [Ensete ventricosum]|nr:hypothetical protein BHE74_00024400 [Ensete ventricosum]
MPPATGWYQPGCSEERRSVEGEGRRKRGCSKKENRENLNAKPFLDLDPKPPSLDDLDPRGSSEAMARAMEEAVSFIASPATLRLLCCVLCRRPETSTAFDVFVAFFAEAHK